MRALDVLILPDVALIGPQRRLASPCAYVERTSPVYQGASNGRVASRTLGPVDSGQRLMQVGQLRRIGRSIGWRLKPRLGGGVRAAAKPACAGWDPAVRAGGLRGSQGHPGAVLTAGLLRLRLAREDAHPVMLACVIERL